jgi:hypothetical protein
MARLQNGFWVSNASVELIINELGMKTAGQVLSGAKGNDTSANLHVLPVLADTLLDKQ